MIDVCCGLSVSPALFVPPVNPCTCTLVAMLVLAGYLALSFSIFVALSGVAVTHIVLCGITITLVARTLRERRRVHKTTSVGHDRWKRSNEPTRRTRANAAKREGSGHARAYVKTSKTRASTEFIRGLARRDSYALCDVCSDDRLEGHERTEHQLKIITEKKRAAARCITRQRV